MKMLHERAKWRVKITNRPNQNLWNEVNKNELTGRKHEMMCLEKTPSSHVSNISERAYKAHTTSNEQKEKEST